MVHEVIFSFSSSAFNLHPVAINCKRINILLNQSFAFNSLTLLTIPLYLFHCVHEINFLGEHRPHFVHLMLMLFGGINTIN